MFGTHTHRLLDRLGITISLLCAVHCALAPLAVGILVASGFAWVADKGTEHAILAGSLLIGLVSLVPGYRRHHGKRRCLTLFFSGVILILAARGLATHEGSELVGVIAGALLITTAHVLNIRLCHACRDCRS